MKSVAIALALAGAASAQQTVWGQCGGQGWTGPTTCAAGSTCTYSNPYYSQCLPGGNGGGSSSTTKTTTTTSKSTTTTSKSTTTTTKTSSSATSSSPPASTGKVKYAGVNIAGDDFGCSTDGTCLLGSFGAYPPGAKGNAQMLHFVKDDGLNAFRLPVGWQFLVNGNLGGNLDSTNFATYDQLVQGCLASGASLCEIDVHNYARWDGGIIGQGGPTNAQFASLWSQIAAKYANNPKIAFGVMNEPHDLNITTWAGSVQAAVTAIRQAGATQNLILIPGTDYTSAANFLENGSGAALLPVHNLDGSTTNIIFDVHKYLDSDNSGTHSNCVTNNVAAFQTLGDWLRQNNRQAMLTETGGGPDDSSCLTYVCQELAFLNSYSDVYLGWIGWAAGNFDTSYVLSEVPTQNSDGSWTDVPLVTQCIAGEFNGRSS